MAKLNAIINPRISAIINPKIDPRIAVQEGGEEPAAGKAPVKKRVEPRKTAKVEKKKDEGKTSIFARALGKSKDKKKGKK